MALDGIIIKRQEDLEASETGGPQEYKILAKDRGLWEDKGRKKKGCL